MRICMIMKCRYQFHPDLMTLEKLVSQIWGAQEKLTIIITEKGNYKKGKF